MRRLWQITGLLLFCLALAAAAPDTPAPEQSATPPDGWQTEMAASYRYGQQLTFTLNVLAAPAAISEATLSFQAAGLPYNYTVTAPPPGAVPFAIVHTIDLTDPGFDWQLLPFATVTYQWLLQTAGAQIELTPGRFFYDDDQFDWQHWQTAAGDVYWPGADGEMAELVAAVVTESAATLRAMGLGGPPDDLRIFIYPTVGDLRAGLRLAGVDWVGDHATAPLPVVVATAVNARTAASDLRRALPHQLGHLLLARALPAGTDSLPIWFGEGLTRSAALAPDPTADLLLQEALAAGTVLPLTELCAEWPTGAEALAAAQSVAVVQFVRERFGPAVVNDFLSAAAAAPDCEATTMAAIGLSSAELQSAWLAQRSPAPTPAQWWQRNGLWLLILLAGFIISGLLILGLTTRVDHEDDSSTLERIQ